MTISFSAEAEAPVPAERAWAVLADYSRDAEWRHQVVSMVSTPPGPAEPGQTTAEVMRFAGRTLHNDGEVVTSGPGLRFTWRTTSGVDAEGAREVVPLGADRCRVVLRTRVHPTGAERYYAPLARFVLRHGLRKDLRRFVQQL
ncbi:SRPBCC family protein [Pseudonocardia xishanensis]|uniref:Polyketide cyclase/dehydrase/lipid transport protein n=1 Tax=Pseudonocardia xishanensis TaxID=630995 RepID=A0ABP8RZW8_9PSEU